MTSAINVARVLISHTLYDSFRQTNRNCPVLFAVPKPHRYIDIFQPETPRLGINLCVNHYAFDRSSPRSPRAFKTRFERRVVAEDRRIVRMQKLQDQWTQSNRNPPGGKGLPDMESYSQHYGRGSKACRKHAKR